MPGARWFTLRHDFIDWFRSVIEPSTIVTRPSSTVHRLSSFADGSDVNGEPEGNIPPRVLRGLISLHAIFLKHSKIDISEIFRLLVRLSRRIEAQQEKCLLSYLFFRTKLLQPTTHAQRYAAIRQTNGLSIVKPTAMVETKGPWVSMVLLRRISV
jgi:hypothetical protein